jgi:hypothetical protein
MDRLPRRLLYVEGLAVLVGSLAVYFDAGFGWLLLLVLPTGFKDTHLQRV